MGTGNESLVVNIGVALALVAAFWFVARRIKARPAPPISAAQVVTDPVYLAWVRGIYTDVLARAT